MANKLWTRRKINYGFGIQPFSNSLFGSPSDREFTFKKTKLKEMGIKTTGQMGGLVFEDHGDEVKIKTPKKVMNGHYHNLKIAKQNSLLKYVRYKWSKLPESKKDEYRKRAEGKPLHGHNLHMKEYIKNYGFGKGGFGKTKFGSPHYPLHYYGFGTVAFGLGSFGSPYPEPRRIGFGKQPFGESRFGGRILKDRKIRDYY